MAPIKRVPPPPSTHSPLRFSVLLRNGKTFRVTRTPRGAVQLRMAVNGVTYPGPEFDESDLPAVRAILAKLALKIAEEKE
jgi:hypothetical protein